MRLLSVAFALVVCAAGLPAWADKRLDDAVAKAEAQLSKGKPEEAVKILQKAVAQAPRDPEPSLALFRMFTRLGRLDEAGTALAKAGELASTAPPERACAGAGRPIDLCPSGGDDGRRARVGSPGGRGVGRTREPGRPGPRSGPHGWRGGS